MAEASQSIPSTMRAWLWTIVAGGLEKNLHLSESAPRPGQLLGKDDVVVQIISMSLNPADYRVPEVLGRFIRLLISTPASPGMDFSGRVVDVGSSVKGFSTGQLVFGCLGRPVQYGSLAEYLVCPSDALALLPDGVHPDDAACLGVAAQTPYQVIKTPSKPGDCIFINGGSGGTGIFSIQIAKILGWHVTVTCSTKNITFCQELGADEVIDYTTMDVVQSLKDKGPVFGQVIDNIGTPNNLYGECHHFLRPGELYSQVNIASFPNALSRLLWPGFLGGGKRNLHFDTLGSKQGSLVKLGEWLQEGKLKAVIDSKFSFEDAPKAYEQLRTHRARGKIVIHVSEQPPQ